MTESYAAENIGDYLKLIDQAISGIEQEITVSGHDDEHHIHQVKDYLYNTRIMIAAGKFVFGARDLDYMSLIDQIRDDVPDYALLVAINDIQKAGALA